MKHTNMIKQLQYIYKLFVVKKILGDGNISSQENKQ